MREVQINRNLILREDGKLFNVHTGEEFIPKSMWGGYYQVSINSHKRLVHRLIMEHFGPPKPGPEYEVDHINRNKLDNRLENLRWITHAENLYNRNNNQPIGKRVCDYETKTEYKREYMREYCRKYRAKKKKEGH
jgi:hypothetical protein